MEGWKAGRLEGWRVEGLNARTPEGSKAGELEHQKIGRQEKANLFPVFQPSSLPGPPSLPALKPSSLWCSSPPAFLQPSSFPGSRVFIVYSHYGKKGWNLKLEGRQHWRTGSWELEGGCRREEGQPDFCPDVFKLGGPRPMLLDPV